MSHLFRLARFALLPLAIALSLPVATRIKPRSRPITTRPVRRTRRRTRRRPIWPPAPDNSGAPSYQQSPPPPDQSSYDPGYGEQPEYTAAQPPPPLPEYDQPPVPGDDYIWTPGYWAWSPDDGYYWVPGAWVEAPYEGALWTPGYWGYWDNSYGFYPGYWGQYIGYYGGINYGFGYVGYGYQGGYWGGGHFYYNRSVNNVNVSVVHNVYSRSVTDNTNNSHVSYNGGSGGIQARARPAELAAMHQPHTAPMRAQVQNQRAAGANRAQFANTNHGRPANVAVSQPLAADRNVKAPPALQRTNRAVEQQQAAPGDSAASRGTGDAPQHNSARQLRSRNEQRQATPQERAGGTATAARAQAPQQQRQAAPHKNIRRRSTARASNGTATASTQGGPSARKRLRRRVTAPATAAPGSSATATAPSARNRNSAKRFRNRNNARQRRNRNARHRSRNNTRRLRNAPGAASNSTRQLRKAGGSPQVAAFRKASAADSADVP